MSTIVIAGAGLAGLRAAETLRNGGFNGAIQILNGESPAPYDRPPLSKRFLSDSWDHERIALRKSDDLAALNLSLINDTLATALDTSANTVRLSNGGTLSYDGLIIATGCRVRAIPGQPTAKNLVMLRTIDDATRLREQLRPGARIVIIGAGFIGLEVASTAKTMGCEVTVLEGLPAPLIRGLGEEMGSQFAHFHRERGVDLRCGVKVDGFTESDGAVTEVIADGAAIPADVVVVGIGVAPNIEWIEGSGLVVDNGVVCDANLNAGVPNVFAAGDIVRWPNAACGIEGSPEVMRIEHWTNAVEQGVAAAGNLLAHLEGKPLTEFASVPFFWSDQFDKRIQFMGRSHAEDQVEMITGSFADGKFIAAYGHGDRLCGVLGLSMPKPVMLSRAVLMERLSFSEGIERLKALIV